MTLADEHPIPAADLHSHPVPEGPGAYCWWHGDQPLHVGSTDNLAHQLCEIELVGPQSPVPPMRSRARVRLQRLGRWNPELDGDRSKENRARVIDQFLHDECKVAWVTTDTREEATTIEVEVHEELFDKPPGENEDKWLDRYLHKLDDPGRVYVEVPVGNRLKGRPRYIDAVCLPQLPPAESSAFDRDAFEEDLTAAGRVEIIEVKKNLHRGVVGQLLVARDFAAQEWDLPSGTPIDLVALVTATDAAIEGFCARNGIRVERVERYASNAVSSDESE